MRLTVSLPCYKRPLRTKRAIECILTQDTDGWEAFIMGDGCPDFQNLIDTGWMDDAKKKAEEKGNVIHFFNSAKNQGGCGYALTNHAIQNASGKYFVFFANDDVILPNHFSSYLSEIEGTLYDFVYFNSWIDPTDSIRDTKVGNCQIGHSEIISRTDFIKQMPEHKPVYGHDWTLISKMAASGNYKKASVNPCTYRVMHLPNQGTKDKID